jgi:hypothetical protein
LSDFPKSPFVPLDGSPTVNEPSKNDSASNHPSLRDTGPDCPQDWDNTVGARIAAENKAEHDGISYNAAFSAIRAGSDDKGEQNKPRSDTRLGEAGWSTWQTAGE